MTFTAATAVENLVRDLLCGGLVQHTAAGADFFNESEVADG